MFRKIVLSTLVFAAVVTPLSLTPGAASAQEFYGRPWHDNRGWGGPSPEWHHHHHRDYGGLVAGGIAAGLVGGLIGTAIENSGPRYYTPSPHCWYQRQTVQDQYDNGYHVESVRVCN
ncbi:complement resistance protein TraT [Neorhizobium sp. P12A]|jgi:hypothetical protein|uniref:complement resistance protein TraT n=1 Tax=Neorhizobium sp. P12A TaxID=2268027 RepID=UPI001FF032C4|nr:complement resistance protein TraT [Neorhizobium sp. P12A]